MISTHLRATVTMFVLLSCTPASLWGQKESNTTGADPSAIKDVVAGYSEAFNHHDARATASLLAEDADCTNMRQSNRRGQKQIAQIVVTLYAGILKNAHRTDIVKSIRFLTPEIAVMGYL